MTLSLPPQPGCPPTRGRAPWTSVPWQAAQPVPPPGFPFAGYAQKQARSRLSLWPRFLVPTLVAAAGEIAFMHIVFAASECVPFAKTGGLADVVGALPPELVKLGHQVTVYLPLYASVRRHLDAELAL